METAAGVSSGNRLTPAETRLGRIALLTADDTPHYEPFAISSMMGCSIVVVGASPFNDPADFARYRAQEQRLFVICPGCFGGTDFGWNVDSPSMIYAPRNITRSQDGILAFSDSKKSAMARMYIQRLHTQIDLYCDDKNAGFYRDLLF